MSCRRRGCPREYTGAWDCARQSRRLRRAAICSSSRRARPGAPSQGSSTRRSSASARCSSSTRTSSMPRCCASACVHRRLTHSLPGWPLHSLPRAHVTAPGKLLAGALCDGRGGRQRRGLGCDLRSARRADGATSALDGRRVGRPSHSSQRCGRLVVAHEGRRARRSRHPEEPRLAPAAVREFAVR